jgi:hypothetical protein
MGTGKWSNMIALAAAIVLVIVLGVQRIQLDTARDSAVRAALVADTLEATRDSSRALSIEGAALGESLTVVQRRAIQATQTADALDKALGLERVARDQLQATIVEMQAQVASDTIVVEAHGDSVRSATFDVRQAPYTLHAAVELPRESERGRLRVRVELDTLALDVRIGCGSANAYGARIAEVSAVAPGWASLRIGRVEQAAGLCTASGPSEPGGRWSTVRSVVARLGLSVGYTATRMPTGAIVGGVGAVVGLRVWP